MKRLYFVLISTLVVNYCPAQTNTFPASGNVGIGTTSPFRTLDIVSSVSTGNVPVLGLTNTSGATPNTFGPGIVLDNRVSGKAPFIINERQDVTSRFSISRATSPYTDYLCILQNGNVLIGNWNQANSSYKLDVSGNIRANKVVVNSTGADYVFDADYHLPDLDSVAVYVQEYHHLPAVPSATQMQTNGLDLGQSQMQLLSKIEEFTLYLIKQNEIIVHQRSEIKELKKEIKAIKKKMKRSGDG